MTRRSSQFPAQRARRRSQLAGSLTWPALFLALACPNRQSSAGELHGSLTAGTDYVFRGVSQTDEEPTVYGSLDYGFDSGFFVGLFAAAIDYPQTPFKPDPGEVEVDAIVGFSRPAGREFEWDVSLIHYAFPGSASSNDNYQEIAFNLHYRDSARFGLAASNDAGTGGASGWIAELELRHALGGRVQASGTLGRYALAHRDWRDYLYWDLGVSAEAGRLTLDLRYFDTNDAAATFAGPRLTGERYVASVSIGF